MVASRKRFTPEAENALLRRAIYAYMNEHLRSVRGAGGQYCHCDHCAKFRDLFDEIKARRLAQTEEARE